MIKEILRSEIYLTDWYFSEKKISLTISSSSEQKALQKSTVLTILMGIKAAATHFSAEVKITKAKFGESIDLRTC